MNNAFSAVGHLPKVMGKPFWEKGIETWDIINHVGLRSQYVASLLAAQHMGPRKQGLIINLSSLGGLSYIFDVAYGVGKVLPVSALLCAPSWTPPPPPPPCLEMQRSTDG